MDELTMNRQVEAILKDAMSAEESRREQLAQRLDAVLALPAEQRRAGIRDVLRAHELDRASDMLDTQEALEKTWGGELLEKFKPREQPHESKTASVQQPESKPRQTLGLEPGGSVAQEVGDRDTQLSSAPVGEGAPPNQSTLSERFGVVAADRHLRTQFRDAARAQNDVER